MRVKKSDYTSAPANLFTEDPSDITFSGKPGTAFVQEIADIEDKMQEMRMSIARYLLIWGDIKNKAIELENAHVEQRATNEIEGLFKLLNRMTRACS